MARCPDGRWEIGNTDSFSFVASYASSLPLFLLLETGGRRRRGIRVRSAPGAGAGGAARRDRRRCSGSAGPRPSSPLSSTTLLGVGGTTPAPSAQQQGAKEQLNGRRPPCRVGQRTTATDGGSSSSAMDKGKGKAAKRNDLTKYFVPRDSRSNPSTHQSTNVRAEQEQEVEKETENIEDSVEAVVEEHVEHDAVVSEDEATATVERAFSAMKIIKTELRNKMSDGWLNDLMVCYIERGIFKNLDLDKIKRDFQNQGRAMPLPGPSRRH